MRVLFNVYPIAFDVPGGGEIQLLKTKEALIAANVEIELFNQWKPQFGWAQLVHYFSVFGGSSVFCDYVKGKGLPLVISPILWPKGDITGYPMHEIQHLLSKADLLFPNSTAEAEALSEVFNIPIEKFHVTHNGVDAIFLEKSQPSPELFKTHFNINEQFVLCVGNIEKRKNQIRLAQAAARLRIKTLLIGNIRDQAYLEETLRLGSGFVSYLGSLPHHDPLLRSGYRACSVFALPSLLETPGLAALEAAALGSKIVITEVGSTREYFGTRASYVFPEDVDSIMQGLKTALGSRDSFLNEQIGKFSWQATAQQAIDGYTRLLK